jgi:hypothetical protein
MKHAKQEDTCSDHRSQEAKLDARTRNVTSAPSPFQELAAWLRELTSRREAGVTNDDKGFAIYSEVCDRIARARERPLGLFLWTIRKGINSTTFRNSR